MSLPSILIKIMPYGRIIGLGLEVLKAIGKYAKSSKVKEEHMEKLKEGLKIIPDEHLLGALTEETISEKEEKIKREVKRHYYKNLEIALASAEVRIGESYKEHISKLQKENEELRRRLDEHS